MDISLVFQNASGWWILACLLLGTAYAWFLYRGEKVLGATLRRLLFVLRALTVALLAFLLLSPLLRSSSRKIEKPLIVIAQDNSASLLLDEENRSWYTGELPGKLNELGRRLEEKYEVHPYLFGDRVERGLDVDFSGKQTDISGLFREIRTRFAGRNLGAVILLSDGIYNRGSNPLYTMRDINAPVYTVALGDTIPKKDLLVASVDHNRIVFLGNDFRINVHIAARGLGGSGSRLSVRHKGRQVFSRKIAIEGDDFRSSIPVDLTAEEKGTQQYEISLDTLPGEVTTRNNNAVIFMDVIDSRQKILILGAAPHPDLGALRQALGSKDDYEVDTRLIRDFDTDSLGRYDLVVLHQLPSPGHDIGTIMDGLRRHKLPFWFMVGNQTAIDRLNASQQAVSFSAFRNSYNDAFPLLAPGFHLFTIPPEARERLAALPPLSAPFCEIGIQAPGPVLFNQRIGTVATGRPLMAFTTWQGIKSAWLFGEGLWRWRLHDFRAGGDHSAVDELIVKTVQYLAAREDKRRFRVTLPKPVFDENEPVRFSAELYNESYEPVTGPEIRLLVQDRNKRSFPFVFSRAGEAYYLDAGIFPAGEYTYTATAELGGNESRAEGSFTVRALNIEELRTTANHQLLYTMAAGSGGAMVYPREMDRLYDLLSEKEEITPVVSRQERYRGLIDLKGVFVLLFLFLAAEWFLRKRNGLY